MTRTLHPFPARMAPTLAIDAIHSLAPGRTVLDPMAGSGTVVREATERGHKALGFDVDPLAILMASVWTTPVSDNLIEDVASAVLLRAKKARRPALPWIDRDDETRTFVSYWFAAEQEEALRSLSWALWHHGETGDSKHAKALDVLRLSLSRIIVTKNGGASLARDVSHSRPHRVAGKSAYDVFEGFERSVQFVRKVLLAEPPCAGARVRFGDARRLKLPRESVDLVLTSPPYLNAIDYIRGHRLSLVWLGHTLSSLRSIRAEAIGTERGPNSAELPRYVASVSDAMTSGAALASRHERMVKRYAFDLLLLMKGIHRVLRPGGRAVLVVGNSCIRGTFIRNSEGVVTASVHAGLHIINKVERDLPESKRYLPLNSTTNSALGKRMRTESVLTFSRAQN